MSNATSTITSDIAANIALVRQHIAEACESVGRDPADVTLVGVSKTFSAEHIAAAHQAGLRDFGENWVQEASEKLPALSTLSPRPTWRLIGHLQTNKVKSALQLFDVIESVDSLRLAETLARHARDRRVPVLLEVNVAGESSKFGFRPDDVPAAVKAMQALPQLDVRGLMTIAPETDDPETVRPVFRQLRTLRDDLGLRDLSMGMSGDYRIAIQEGATIVRIGRAIFGARQY